MPRRRPRTDAFSRAFQFFDIFGTKVGFNINGESNHTTMFGGLYTLFIIAWLVLILNYAL
jgi:hypothetical protein